MRVLSFLFKKICLVGLIILVRFGFVIRQSCQVMKVLSFLFEKMCLVVLIILVSV